MTQGLVLKAAGERMTVEDITLAATGPGMVRVRLAAAGVCHSDLSLARGKMPYPLPAVLGHEGAGVVVEVGEDVQRVAPGDHVILSWSPPCRECSFCTAGEPHLCDRALATSMEAPYAELAGERLYPMQGVGAFAQETLVVERAVVPVDPALPLEVAAVIGCAVTTGVGAALNTARVQPGSSVAVVGCGGVGLSIIQGAKLAGAERILAVDRSAERLELASQLGATEQVSVADGDPVAAVSERTGWRGVDYAFEAVGRSETIQQAFSMTRRGGQTVVVGASAPDDMVALGALELFFSARQIVGSVYGSTDPDRDLPRLAELYLQGQLDLDRLLGRRIGLDEVDEAFADMEAGHGARSLVVFDGEGG